MIYGKNEREKKFKEGMKIMLLIWNTYFKYVTRNYTYQMSTLKTLYSELFQALHISPDSLQSLLFFLLYLLYLVYYI